MTCPSSCHDVGCTLTYRQHLLGVGISAMALPSRKKTVIGWKDKERTLDREHSAYKRLRADGLQPPKREGSAQLEARAECAEQVNTGMLHVKPRSWQVYAEETGRSALEPA